MAKNISVGIIMGSISDLDIMQKAADCLKKFGVAHEVRIVSAHRTPEWMMEYAASAATRGLNVIIAGAGGSAHLPGMVASHTALPVIGVPVKRPDHDHEALWSLVKMPAGIPLATMPENGAENAALLAVRILALTDEKLAGKYRSSVVKMAKDVLALDKKLQSKKK